MKVFGKRREGISAVIGIMFFLIVFVLLFSTLYYTYSLMTRTGKRTVDEKLTVIAGFDEYAPVNMSTVLEDEDLLQRGDISSPRFADFNHLVMKSKLVGANYFLNLTVWFKLNVTASKVTQLNVIVHGHYDRQVSQLIRVFNYATNDWERSPLEYISTKNEAVSITNQASPADLISSDRFVKVCVSANATSSFYGFIDYVHLKVIPTPDAGNLTVWIINEGPIEVQLSHLWLTTDSFHLLANKSSPTPNYYIYNYSTAGLFYPSLSDQFKFPPTGYEYLHPGDSLLYCLACPSRTTKTYTVRVVSKRGNVWSWVITPSY